MIYKFFLTLFFIGFFAVLSPTITAQEVKKDSTTTPFRKGRWLVGLAGSIGSSSTENTSSESKLVSNHYRIEISSGKFVMNRLNIGLNANLERENVKNRIDEERSSENLFIGPKFTYFISKSEVGSLYFGITPGFVLYRDARELNLNEDITDVVNKGSGFGLFSSFGYVYVIQDRIAFDVSLNWSSYWIDINQETLNIEQGEDINFVLSDLTFAFGFNILLD